MGEEFIFAETKQGTLRGLKTQSKFSDKSFCQFRGIPYAKPPVGELRFKAPVDPEPWEGVKDALQDGSDCKQQISSWARLEHPDSLTEGSEDCLFLNISTNTLEAVQPVMVFLHGGGFMGGTGNTRFCGPDLLMEEPVVLVTVNYRCGSFGFLSLGTEEVPGNAGLKDQILALRWVRDNISNFGGDPDNVTIFGISAGAASVHYHLLSPLSQGLFHKAIIQSGSALNPWALQENPSRNASRLAELLGCPSQDTSEILTFLQGVPADELVLAEKKLSEESISNTFLGLVFTPCVEVVGTNAFLSTHPETLMKSGGFQRVPVVMGTTANEGSIFLTSGGITDTLLEGYNSHPDLFTSFTFAHNHSKKSEIAKEILDFYVKEGKVTWDNLDELVEFFSDLTVNEGVARTRRWLLEHTSQPLYSYLVNDHSLCVCTFKKSLVPNLDKFDKLLTGTCHGGEFMHIFYMNLSETFKTPMLTQENKEAIRKFTKAWTNFALKGDPNSEDCAVEWIQDSLTEPSHVNIDQHWTLNNSAAFQDRMNFWSQLRSRYQK